MTHVFDGEPDARQSSDPAMPTSRFRPRYRALTEEEKALHDEIKLQAADLEALIEKVPDGRDKALAMTHLEDSIMRAVRALTA